MSKIYSIHDSKAAFFNVPFFQRNHDEAARSFGQIVNDSRPDNLLHQSPADFTLYCLGSFDEQTGELDGNNPAESADLLLEKIANGLDVLKAVNPNQGK